MQLLKKLFENAPSPFSTTAKPKVGFFLFWWARQYHSIDEPLEQKDRILPGTRSSARIGECGYSDLLLHF